MEAHHHSYVENQFARQAGKGFKEYFFEIIIIFLVEVMGFKNLSRNKYRF